MGWLAWVVGREIGVAECSGLLGMGAPPALAAAACARGDPPMAKSLAAAGPAKSSKKRVARPRVARPVSAIAFCGCVMFDC